MNPRQPFVAPDPISITRWPKDIVEPAPDRMNNIYHGYMRQGPHNDSLIPVSFIVMKDYAIMSGLRDRLASLKALSKKDNIISPVLAIDASDSGSFSPVLLVMERFSPDSFDDWVGKRPPLLLIKKFFRKLGSSLSELHGKRNFFGNLQAVQAVRVHNDKPTLVIPAQRNSGPEVVTLGIREDITSFLQMVSTAFSNAENLTNADFENLQLLRIISHDLSDYDDDNLIDLSYIFFHAPLFWDVDDDDFTCDLYDMVMAMNFYRLSDEKIYYGLVSDNKYTHTKRIGLDWKAILKSGASTGALILADTKYLEMCDSSVYQHSHSLVYFLRCFFQHPFRLYTKEEFIKLVYEVFPTAGTSIYQIFFERLFLGDIKYGRNANDKRQMKHRPVEFIRACGHGFRF